MIPITEEVPSLEEVLALVDETTRWLDERAAVLMKAQSHRGGTNLHALDLLREQVRGEAARISGRAQLIRFEAARLRPSKKLVDILASPKRETGGAA